MFFQIYLTPMKRLQQNHKVFYNVQLIFLSYKIFSYLDCSVFSLHYELFMLVFFRLMYLSKELSSLWNFWGWSGKKNGGRELGLFGWRAGNMTLGIGSLVIPFSHYHFRVWWISVLFRSFSKISANTQYVDLFQTPRLSGCSVINTQTSQNNIRTRV